MERRIADPQALGVAIREARAGRHWTQAELAHRAGVSRSFVLDVERGNRPRAELVRVLSVVKALGKSISLVDDAQPGSFDDVLNKVLG
jgi:HTH-type transcriptional regulator/antitoxin HipB